MKQPFLIGERVYLRSLLPEDAQGNYVNWLNDEEVCRYNSHHVFPYPPSSAEEYIRAMANNRQAITLAVCLKDTDEHIGNITLNRIEPISRQAEFAIVMGEKQHWGKGYSKEAAYLLCDHGFKTLNLNRIHCGTAEDNIAMQKLAAYLGMKEEGRRRQAHFKNGRYVDLVEYGVLRDEFITKFQLEKAYQQEPAQR